MHWCNVTIPIICLIVCIATSSSEVTRNLKTKLEKYLELHQKGKLCPLITPFYLIMFAINQCDMLKLIWWDLCFSSIVYPSPCKQMNYWVDLLLLYLVLGSYCFIMIMFQLWCCLIIVHDKVILLIGTWSDHPGKQYYHNGGMGCPWLTN
jgi:hypothetical protein